MVHVSVMYPNIPGSRFDWDYYMNKHMVAVRKALEGMVRAEVDKGIAAAQPGAAAPFVAIANLYFNTMEDLQKSMAASAGMMADLPNFTSIQPQVQISEVL